jgi:RHS repeat-associated protein
VESHLDFTGKATETRTKHKRTSSAAELTTQEFFTYAPQGQMISHIHQVGSQAPQQLSVPQYDALGQLIRKDVGGLVGGAPLQRVDYRYNIRGWMTQINDVNDLQDDLFSFKINYNIRDHHQSTLLYNGNISATYWRTQTDNTKRHYSYYYDALNRLNDAHYGKNDQITHNYNESLSYDKNGNITHLVRYGINDYGDPIPIDDIFYNYKNNNVSNQLMRVSETPYGNAAQGFKDGTNTGDDYMYDAFGNMNKDENKGITSITYNHLNLPKKITFGDGNHITYIYSSTGTKISKIVIQGETQATTMYLGSFQYNNNTLQFIQTEEGYVRHTPPSSGTNYGAFDYVYNYTDHLGNIRLSYTLDPSDQVLKILEENHYYPFGMKHSYNTSKRDIRTVDAEIDLNGNLFNPINNFSNFEPSEDIRRVRMVSNTGYQYKYNGKEYQNELGLNFYDYGWRNYDPAIARWVNSDPLLNDLDFAFDDSGVDDEDEEEVYELLITKLETGGGIYNTNNLNPYIYGYNNPISFDDPDGRCPWCIAGLKGVLFEYATQVIGNISEGKDLGDALTDIDGGEILKAGVTSALTMGVGGFINKGTKVVGLANKTEKVNEVRKNTQKAEKVINGNSKLSKKAQVNYRVTNTKTGKSKTGISGGKVDKNGNPYRANKQANAWNKKDGKGTWKVEVVSKTKSGAGARAKALAKEKKDADALRKAKKLDEKKHKRP